MRILVATEKDDLSGQLGEWLSLEGNEISHVDRGSEVIDRVYGELPDVILLGLNLPEKDALTLLKRLKTAPSTSDIPVFMVTPRRVRRKLRLSYRLGATDYILTPYFPEEVIAKCENILSQRRAIKELEGSASRDFLTGLYNRRYFMEKLAEEFTWSIGYHEPLALLVLDIDHFKKINDTYGHPCGDEVLRQIAGIIGKHLDRNYLAARLGGEEFALLLPNRDEMQAFCLGETLRAEVEGFPFVDPAQELTLRLTVSIGVSIFNGQEIQSSDGLLREADAALYEAKGQGRNRVIRHSDKVPKERVDP
jgi:two-component system cell cycle response regulator